jgi:RNA polymerase sigma-70 factor (ECF subfamily)
MQYVKSREDADEIVNDTFLVVWDKQSELVLDQSIKSFLYTVVRNKSLNLLKKRKIEISELDEDFEIAAIDHSPIEVLQAKETEAAVFELIEKLPTKCRQIFLLSRREYLSNKEIAAVMEINEKTVENQIGIAIKFIRSGLQGIKHHNNSDANGLKMIIFPWLLAWLLN